MEALLDMALAQLRAWVATEMGATTVGGILVGCLMTVGYRLLRFGLARMGIGQPRPIREEIQSIIDATRELELWSPVTPGDGAVLKHYSRECLRASKDGGVWLSADNNGANCDVTATCCRRERKLLRKAVVALFQERDRQQAEKNQAAAQARLKSLAAGLRRDHKDLKG